MKPPGKLSSSIRVTMDVYSHLMPGMDSEAVAVIDRMLKPTPLRDPLRDHPENAESENLKTLTP